MKITLHETPMECYEQMYTSKKIFEISGESVIPDKLPDIGMLGETSAHVILRAKRTENDSGTMEGDLQTSVCYIPDGAAGFYGLDIVIPWHVQFESDQISEDSIAVGKVEIQHLESRMLNPRKVLVKAQLCASFAVYEKRTLSISDEMVDDTTVQVQKESVECSLIGTVCERTFTATDEYPLPAELAGGTILCKSVQLRVDDIKTLANKLIVKGSAISDVIITGEQGNTDRISFTSSFSFISETDCEGVSADICTAIMPTALYYELTAGGRTLSVEVHGVCQMVSYKKYDLQYISDAYSNFYSCDLEMRPLTVYMDTKSSLQRETVTVTIPARSQIERIHFVTASVLKSTDNNMEEKIPVCVSVAVRYENGTTDWVKKQTEVSFRTKETEHLTAVRVADVYSMVNGTETEVRVALDADVREEYPNQIHTVSAIELNEEAASCFLRPAITVIRAGGKLWNLARDYGSTVSLIQKYNQIEEDEVAPNTLLLIPKQSG